MKKFMLILVLATLAGCGTIGGAVSGAAEDLGKVGEYIKKI